MCIYLQIPILTHYMINSPKLNLFGKQNNIRRDYFQRLQSKPLTGEPEGSFEDFKKWKKHH